MRWRSSVYTRDKVRPAWSDGGCERDKVRPAHEKWPKIGVLLRAGRVFSRKCRWRGGAGRSFSHQPLQCQGLVDDAAHFRLAAMGVCAMRSSLTACRSFGWRHSPPIGGGELAVCGGVVAKLRTHWVKRTQNRLLWLNGSAIWRNRSLSWCVVRASPPEHAPQSLVAHSAACRGINRLTSCESCYTTVLSSNEAKSGRD